VYAAPVKIPSRETYAGLREGVMASIPLVPGIVPVGALFGAVAVGSGLTPLDAIVMSGVVYAGASQFVAIDLWGQGIPAWSIILSVLAVNFRHVLYSAALTPVFRRLRPATRAAFLPMLVDPLFAFVEKRLQDGRGFSRAAYVGMGITLYVMWLTGSVAGALFGELVEDPDVLALDMLMPLFFLTLVMGFRSRPNWGPTVLAAAVTSVLVYHAPVVGLTVLGPPWHITAGAVAGIAAAVLLAGRGDAVPLDQAAEEETFEPAAREVGR